MSEILQRVRNVAFIRIISIPLEILSGILTARYLSIQDYGLYALVFLFSTLLLSFGSLGIGPSIIYFIGKKKIESGRLFNTLFLFALFLGSLYYISINYLLIDFISPFFVKGRFELYLLHLSTLIIPILLLQKYLRKMLQGYGYVEEFSFSSNFLNSAFKFIFTLLAIYLFDGGLVGLIVSTLISNLCVTVYIIQALFRHNLFNFPSFSLLSRSDASAMFMFASKGHLGAVFQRSNDQLTQLLSAQYLSINEFGYIALALKLTGLFTIGIDVILTVVTPLFARNKHDFAFKSGTRIMRLLFIFTLCISTVFSLFLPFVVSSLYGEKFVPAVNVALLVIPGLVFLSVTKLINLTLNLQGYPTIPSISRLIGFTFNILLLYYLLSSFKEVGYSLALTASYISMFVASFIFYNRKFNIPLRHVLIPTLSEIRDLYITLLAWIQSRSIRQQT